MKLSGFLIHPLDNVLVVAQDAQPGDVVQYRSGDTVQNVTVRDEVPAYHKIARYRIPQDGPAVKYGETIGLVFRDIEPGEHVHVHNMASGNDPRWKELKEACVH